VQIHLAACRFPLLNVTCSSLARGARQTFCSPELLTRAARWICTTVETQLKFPPTQQNITTKQISSRKCII
jgi:hypothetical protein